MPFPSLYRAKAVAIQSGAVTAFVPQVFGESPITITDSLGPMPETMTMGWVFFQAGDPEFPVWSSGLGTGSAGEAALQRDEVWIGPDTPTDPSLELWYDTDAVAPLPAAANVTFAPTSTIAATNVQAAVAEVVTDADVRPKGIVWANSIALSNSQVSLASPTLNMTNVMSGAHVAGRAYRFMARIRACCTEPGAGGGTEFVIRLYQNGGLLEDHYVYAATVAPSYGGGVMDFLWLCPTTGTSTWQFQVAYVEGGGTPKQGRVWAEKPHYMEDLGAYP